MKPISAILMLFATLQAWAGIPATPVMTLYKFNGRLEIPYYSIADFQSRGTARAAGTLAQGTSLIPCLVIRGGRPLTDRKGTPYVGFRIVVDSRNATPADTERFRQTVAARRSMSVPNHHCGNDVRHVISIRTMYNLGKAPFFQPPRQSGRPPAASSAAHGELDAIVRAFHDSPDCDAANRSLIGRRAALSRAWERFIAANSGRWPHETLARAKHLDYAMRTAIYEAHLERGCNAYGTCERNIIALSLRNRGRESCAKYQGCRFPGDFQGVASKVSQYNIWDEYLTQISGLTACFLRPSVGASPAYTKLRLLYEHNVDDVQRILFGSDVDLLDLFPGTPLADLKDLRHYYHAPAMGKCFPNHPRVEYMSGAVARNGGNFALIANTRIQVDQKVPGGYRFREFLVEEAPEGDIVSIVDNYPGFVVDARKVRLKGGSRCPPYGIPRGCRFDRIGRYRRTPPWLKAGKALAIRCRVSERGAQCLNPPLPATTTVGGACDTQMRPVSGVR